MLIATRVKYLSVDKRLSEDKCLSEDECLSKDKCLSKDECLSKDKYNLNRYLWFPMNMATRDD